MSRRAHVPDELRTGPFRGTAAVEGGLLTPDQLRSSVWRRLLRDVYVHASVCDDPAVRVSAVSLKADLRTVICGLTAAWVHGVWEPPPGDVVPLQVTRAVRAPGTSVAGLTRRRLTLRGTADLVRPPTGLSELDRDVVHVGPLLVTSPTRTCFDLMRERQVVEAVAVADAFAYARVVSLPVLDAYCSDRRRWPYVRPARAAVELATPYARSPGESRLRMVVVLAGFMDPLVNVPLVGTDGTEIAVPDLIVLGPRNAALEYDGAYHDDVAQVAADRRRQTRFVARTEIPLLRYDREDVARRREDIVVDVAEKTGDRARFDLRPQDFSRVLRRRTA